MMKIEYHTEKNLETLSRYAANRFLTKIKSKLEYHDAVTIGLCGGRSVEEFYEAVSNLSSNLTKEEWKKVHFFLTDERLTRHYSRTNRRVAFDESLQDLVRTRILPSTNRHAINYSIHKGGVRGEIIRYNSQLTKISKSSGLEILILSTGEDSHIASLFPNHAALESKESGYIHITDSPKPPNERITISPNLVKKADTAFLLFLGERKRNAYNNFKSNKPIKETPVNLVRSCNEVLVLTDLT